MRLGLRRAQRTVPRWAHAEEISRPRKRLMWQGVRELMQEAIASGAAKAWASGWAFTDSLVARRRHTAAFADAPDAPRIPPDYLARYLADLQHYLYRYSERQQEDIGKIVAEGAASGATRDEVSDQIGEAVRGMLGWQAQRISRTESMRLWNLGSVARMSRDEDLVGYSYEVVLDDRTSDICEPLAGLTVAADQLQLIPPLHPNCRTTLEPVYRFDEGAADQSGAWGTQDGPHGWWGSPADVVTARGFGTQTPSDIMAWVTPRPKLPIIGTEDDGEV